MNKLNRRTFIAATMAAPLVTALPAQALSPKSARRLVDQVVAKINSIIGSGKSEAGMIKDFEELFKDFADVDLIARYTLGVEARSMSNSEIAKYTVAFQGYMARKYGKRFREFIGGSVVVESAKTVKSWVDVKTSATLAGSSPFEVVFSVSDRTGSDKFFNMYIEGVNLLLSERTEILAMLDRRRGKIDKLIQDLTKAG